MSLYVCVCVCFLNEDIQRNGSHEVMRWTIVEERLADLLE